MRCQGVVLLASRISVPSPATPCTLITPNGAPRGQTSRICFLPFAGANAGVCYRMVMPSYLSTLYLVSHTDALYTESPLGRLHRPVAHIERMRLFSVQYAPPTLGRIVQPNAKHRPETPRAASMHMSHVHVHAHVHVCSDHVPQRSPLGGFVLENDPVWRRPPDPPQTERPFGDVRV